MIRIVAGDSLCFLRCEAANALVGLEVILNPECLAVGVHPLECVRAETVHVAVRIRNAAIAEQPRELVRGFRRQREEVPGVFRLLYVSVGIAFLRMNEVGKLQRITNEEDRGVVADEIVVAFLRVKLDGEAARVAHRIRRAGLQRHCGETNE